LEPERSGDSKLALLLKFGPTLRDLLRETPVVNVRYVRRASGFAEAFGVKLERSLKRKAAYRYRNVSA
jgi:hypothetical protein